MNLAPIASAPVSPAVAKELHQFADLMAAVQKAGNEAIERINYSADPAGPVIDVLPRPETIGGMPLYPKWAASEAARGVLQKLGATAHANDGYMLLEQITDGYEADGEFRMAPGAELVKLGLIGALDHFATAETLAREAAAVS